MRRRLLVVTVGLCWAVIALACSSGSSAPAADGHQTTSTMPGRAHTGLQGSAPHDLWVGTAVQGELLGTEARYADTVAREFGVVTPENDMKWGLIHPARNRYDFRAADAVVAFALRHGLAVRGHNLAWHMQNPTWLEQGRFSRSELLAILRAHIRTVVGRYRGRVGQWDVVNEAVADDGSGLRPNVWLNGLGPSYIETAFRAAHAADPKAKLFYNDYLIEQPGPKAERVYRLVADLKRHGAPIDGVGFQTHASTDAPTGSGLAVQMARYGKIGLDTAVTELDVRVAVPVRPGVLAAQAKAYGAFLAACVHEPSCHTFVIWGFTDRHSWVPSFFKGFGAATIFTTGYRPKPAYATLQRTLRRGR